MQSVVVMVVIVVIVLIGLLFAYLLYDPVPDGITEPWKYRALMARFRLGRILIRIQYLWWQGDEPFETYHIKSVRRLMASMIPTPPAEVDGSNIRSKVTEMDGVTVRLYEPIRREDGGAKLPGFIYIHGGGLCIGSADACDGVTRKMAEDLNLVLISIEYRLAPEHPHPAGYEDCLTATRYFMQHADDFGVDRKRIGIGGDSSGGHLSASVAQAIHDDDNVPDLKLQVLIYPWLQKIDLNTPSYQKQRTDVGNAGCLPKSLIATFLSLSALGRYDRYAASHFMTNTFTSPTFKRESVEYSYVNYEQIPSELRDPRYYKSGNDFESGDSAVWDRLSDVLLDARFSPLLRRDVSGLPPAFIITVEFDALRDDGIFYKNRLEEEGIEVKWVNYQEGFHGVLTKSAFQLASTLLRDIIDYVRQNI